MHCEWPQNHAELQDIVLQLLYGIEIWPTGSFQRYCGPHRNFGRMHWWLDRNMMIFLSPKLPILFIRIAFEVKMGFVGKLNIYHIYLATINLLKRIVGEGVSFIGGANSETLTKLNLEWKQVLPFRILCGEDFHSPNFSWQTTEPAIDSLLDCLEAIISDSCNSHIGLSLEVGEEANQNSMWLQDGEEHTTFS